MSKYRNTKIVNALGKFDSQGEYERYLVLLQMQKAGEIEQLTRQVKFLLIAPVVLDGRKKPAIRYVADFCYRRDGVFIVEDFKGVITPVYRMKKHMMKALYGIDILETRSNKRSK